MFFDKNKKCVDIIKENLKYTKLIDKASIKCLEDIEALNFLYKENLKFDLIFLDPPYGKNLLDNALSFLCENKLVSKDGIIIVKRDKNDDIKENYGDLTKRREEKYKDTIISFFQ